MSNNRSENRKRLKDRYRVFWPRANERTRKETIPPQATILIQAAASKTTGATIRLIPPFVWQRVWQSCRSYQRPHQTLVTEEWRGAYWKDCSSDSSNKD